ncbi:hypothetical protein SAMN04488498_1208 [Mesorhizobium albiziae]|uniref:Uncharacterized protein n=1 Tax=Neomesorhizobium albiziae TaxID=335020 RepID=A0A1I4DU89_9HYPH|nr:hypothetical protein SAMN04488498_1208 [Mesorhizobium albiziae]
MNSTPATSRARCNASIVTLLALSVPESGSRRLMVAIDTLDFSASVFDPIVGGREQLAGMEGRRRSKYRMWTEAFKSVRAVKIAKVSTVVSTEHLRLSLCPTSIPEFSDTVRFFIAF